MAVNPKILRQRALLEARIRTNPQLYALRQQLNDRRGQRKQEIRAARDTGKINSGAAVASQGRLRQIYDEGAGRIQQANQFTAQASPDPAQQLGPASALAQALAGEGQRTQSQMATAKTESLAGTERLAGRAREGAVFSERRARDSFDSDASKIYGGILDTLRTQGDVAAKTYQDLWDDAETRDLNERKFAETQRKNAAGETLAAQKLAKGDKADKGKPGYSRDKRIGWRDTGKSWYAKVMSAPTQNGAIVFKDKEGNVTGSYKIANFNGDVNATKQAEQKLWQAISGQAGGGLPSYVAKGIAEMRIYGGIRAATAKRIRKDTGNPYSSYGFRLSGTNADQTKNRSTKYR